MSSPDRRVGSDRRFESRRRSFNAHADDYRDGRPGYPPRVYELLVEDPYVTATYLARRRPSPHRAE